MSGKRPICNYFLLNQHKVAALQCTALAWIKTTCGAGWRKAQAQQAPKESSAPFPCKFPRLFDISKHLIGEKKTPGLQGLLPFMVSAWMGIKAASYFDVFIPLLLGWNVRRQLVKNNYYVLKAGSECAVIRIAVEPVFILVNSLEAPVHDRKLWYSVS